MIKEEVFSSFSGDSTSVRAEPLKRFRMSEEFRSSWFSVSALAVQRMNTRVVLLVLISIVFVALLGFLAFGGLDRGNRYYKERPKRK